MPVEGASRVKADVEDVFVDRFGARVHQTALRRADCRLEQIGFEVAVDFAVLAEREHPRAQPPVAVCVRQRPGKPVRVVRRDGLRQMQSRPRDLAGPGAMCPPYLEGVRVQTPEIEILPLLVGLLAPEPRGADAPVVNTYHSADDTGCDVCGIEIVMRERRLRVGVRRWAMHEGRWTERRRADDIRAQDVGEAAGRPRVIGAEAHEQIVRMLVVDQAPCGRFRPSETPAVTQAHAS